MTNPFDVDDETFHVLVNDELQYSIWPTFATVPSGWSIELANTDRRRCLDYVDERWTDLRPKSLREAADQGS
jgi:MbtH protein